MKVAELFAELGFKVEGKDELKGFETSLQNIANAARQAALALKDLANARIPKQIIIGAAKSGSASAPAGRGPAPGMLNFIGPVQPPAYGGAQGQTARQPRVLPGMLNFIGPVQPTPYSGPPPPLLAKGPPGVSNSVLQGLKSLGMLGLKVLGIATVAVALKKLVSAMIDMVKASMQATYAVDKFTTQTGLSRRELKAWERVAELSDVKAEELQETLKALQQKSRQIRFTGEGATPFLQLGINAMASPTEVMKQFAQRTKQMDTATATFWGNQIGISENMVYALRKNADKLDQLIPNAELGDSDHQAVMQLNMAWKDLMFTLGLLRDKIVSDIAPALKWVLDQVTIWAKLGTMSKDVRTWMLQGGPMNPVGAAQLMSKMRDGSTHKVENNVSVEVSGAGSPKETAKATAEAIKRELSDSYYGRPPPWMYPGNSLQ